MLRYITLISLLLIYSSSKAQETSSPYDESVELFKVNKYPESIAILEDIIKTHNGQAEPILVETYLLLAKNHIHSWNTEQAIAPYHKAYQLSESLENDSLLIEAGTNLASILRLNGKSDSIRIITSRLLALDSLVYSTKSDLHLLLSGYYEDRELLDSAIYYATIAAEIDSIHQDSSSIPYTFYDLGNYHISNFDYATGITKILYGIDFLRGDKDIYKKTAIELGLSNIYYRIGNIPKAEEIAHHALINAKKYNQQINQCNAYNTLGNCADYMENYSEALSYYQKSDSVNQVKSKNIWRGLRAKISIISQKLNLNIPVSQSEIKEIKKLCEGSETTITKNKLDLLLLRVSNYSRKKFDSEYNRLYIESTASKNTGLKRSLLKIKKEYLINQKDYKEALTIDSKIDKMKRDVIKNNNKYIIQDLEAKHRKKEQDIQITYLDQQNIDKTAIVEGQRKKIILGSIAIALIAFLSFFLLRLYQQVNGQKEIITKALKEKDLLLREIHHRVKNNLQLVSSLLTMQGRSINDETAIQAINEGKSRVRSMALIHQDLYSKENLTGISVKAYIEKLTQELFTTYRIDNNKITLETSVEDIELDIDTLVPLGLIINELVTNSLKYAWSEQDTGVLHIELKQNSQHIILQVKDDGAGYDPTSVREQSFGATLISALTLQLNGECNVSTSNGTTVIITIAKMA